MYTIADAAIECLIASGFGRLGTGSENWGGFSGKYIKLPYSTRFAKTGSMAVVSEVAFIKLSSKQRELVVAFPLYRDNSCSFSKQAIVDYEHPIQMWEYDFDSWDEHPSYETHERLLDAHIEEIMEGTIDVYASSRHDISMMLAYIER